MTATSMRKKLHQLIDEMNDERTVAMYQLFEGKTDIDLQRKKLVMEERDRYLKGEGSPSNWSKVKQIAVSKP